LCYAGLAVRLQVTVAKNSFNPPNPGSNPQYLEQRRAVEASFSWLCQNRKQLLPTLYTTMDYEDCSFLSDDPPPELVKWLADNTCLAGRSKRYVLDCFASAMIDSVEVLYEMYRNGSLGLVIPKRGKIQRQLLFAGLNGLQSKGLIPDPKPKLKRGRKSPVRC